MSTEQYRPEWLVISVMCAISVAGALQYMLLVPVVPLLPKELDATPAEVSWLVTASVLTGTVATPIIARIADMVGRRRLIFFCLTCIVVGSTIGLITNDLWVLVVARAVSGMSNAAVPIGIAVVQSQLPPHRRALGIGLVGTSGGVGVGLALPVGGWLSAAFGWHSIFAFMLGLAAILLVLLPIAVSATGPRLRGRFDFAGAILFAIALTALLLAISNGVAWGWLSVPVLVLVGVAAVIGTAWCAVERRVAIPLVNLRLTTTKVIVFTSFISLAFGFTVFGNILVMTSQLQVPEDAGGFGLDPLLAGTVLSIPAFTIMFAAPIAGLLVQRTGARNLLIAAAVFTFAGYAIRFGSLQSLAWIIVGSIIIQLGSSAAMASIPVIVTMNAPTAEVASANGVNALIRSIGSTLSAATVAASFTLTAVSPSGIEFPAPAAFLIFFGIASSCGLVAFILGFGISADGRAPRRRR